MAALRILAKRPLEVLLTGVQRASTDRGQTLSLPVEAVLGQWVEVAVTELRGRSTPEVSTVA